MKWLSSLRPKAFIPLKAILIIDPKKPLHLADRLDISVRFARHSGYLYECRDLTRLFKT